MLLPEYVTSVTVPVASLILHQLSRIRDRHCKKTHVSTLMRMPYIDSTTVLPEIVTPETDLLPAMDPMEMP